VYIVYLDLQLKVCQADPSNFGCMYLVKGLPIEQTGNYHRLILENILAMEHVRGRWAHARNILECNQ
jgi:hypothetical protein